MYPVEAGQECFKYVAPKKIVSSILGESQLRNWSVIS